MKRLRLFAFCALQCLCGCESTGVGNPGLSVTAQSAVLPEPEAVDPAERLSGLTHAVLALGELRWLACDSALAPAVMPGPFVVDLVSGDTRPAFPSISIPEGGFCGVDVPLTTAASDVLMQGKSVLVSGARGDGTLFILYAAMPGTIRVRPYPSGTIWDANNAVSVVLALRPARWLTQTEIDAEPSESLGTRRRVIAIDVNRHPVLYQAIRNRLGARSTLNTDLDENGRLDPSDEAAFIGLGEANLD